MSEVKYDAVTNPIWDILRRPDLDNSVTGYELIEAMPDQGSADQVDTKATLDFTINVTNKYLLLSEAFLLVKFKILDAVTGVPFVNMGAAIAGSILNRTALLTALSMFENATLTYDNVPVENITKMYWTQLVKSLLKPKPALDTSGTLSYEFIEGGDVGGPDLAYLTTTANARNINGPSFTFNPAWWKRIQMLGDNNTNEIQALIPLRDIFGYLDHNYMVSTGQQVKFSFTRSPLTGKGMFLKQTGPAADTHDGKAQLTHCALWYPTVKPDAATQAKLAEELNGHDVMRVYPEYVLNNTQLITAAGSQSYRVTTRQGKVSDFYCFFLDQGVFDNANQATPTVFSKVAG